MAEHICHLRDPWPTGHPLPPEDPAKLTGPEVGARVIYHDPKYPRWDGIEMHVTERSYVWSPGECRHQGGYRHYDWSVVCWEQDMEGHPGHMVVDDDKLEVVG